MAPAGPVKQSFYPREPEHIDTKEEIYYRARIENKQGRRAYSNVTIVRNITKLPGEVIYDLCGRPVEGEPAPGFYFGKRGTNVRKIIK